MRRVLLIFAWLVICVHFLKDVTQDILQIPTALDILGNVEEKVDHLLFMIQFFIYIAGVGSFLSEIFLLVAIPIVLRGRGSTKLARLTSTTLVCLIVYFAVIVFFDPRFYSIFEFI
jgi:hypothetical protein